MDAIFTVMIDEGTVGESMELCGVARTLEEAEGIAAKLCNDRVLRGRALRIYQFRPGVPTYLFPPINGANPKLISTLSVKSQGQ